MSQLYTVRLDRKHVVTSYSGKTATTRTELLQETYTGLPLVTAQRYKTLFPDANVVISMDEAQGGKGWNVRVGDEKREPRREYSGTTGKSTRPARKSRSEEPREEASTPGYADLVNELMKEAS